MTVPFVVPFYAGIFALIFFYLTIRVIRLRGAARVSLGGGGDLRLERAIRAHGNFVEYVPLALILLGFMEAQRHSIYALHALCLMLLLGRILHAIGITRAQEANALRATGMVLTGLVLVIAALVLIADFFRVQPTT